MDSTTIQNAVDAFEACETAGALIAAFVDVIKPIGGVGFVAADFSVEDRSRYLLYSSIPEVYGQTDSDSPWWSDDPAAARLAAGEMRPFRIEDAYAERLSTAAARWDLFTALKLDRGWVLPTSRPGSIGGVLMLLEPDAPHLEARDPRIGMLHVIATYLHAFVTELDPPADGAGVITNTLRGRLEDGRLAHLSRREIECLRWCAFGKTAENIAVIESLSVHTVREYLQKAMLKLDARTQAQAVARALKYGLFRI